MLNVTGRFCKVWSVEVRDSMVLVDLTTSKKEKDGSYTNSKYFKVKFVGKCLEQAKHLKEGDKVDITNGLIGKRKYQEKYYDDVVVFGFEYSDGSTNTKQDTAGFEPIEDDGDDLPWT